MSKLAWYWHRLWAMSPGEQFLHARKKLRQRLDLLTLPKWPELPASLRTFPELPSIKTAPQELRLKLRADVEHILAGRWKAFGHVPLQVDQPPRWHLDYLVGEDFFNPKPSFQLDHRKQARVGDIKLIWEPNRWNQLVRLALGAYLLNDQNAANTCQSWLADWQKNNRPYTGLNWTSGLETGLRLLQLVWIDSLIQASGFAQPQWAALCRDLAGPHAHYTWRYCSFGSSANNHLIGELAGLVLALARWPELEKISTTLDALHPRLEKEILLQFDSDGNNREQALGYHLFSWEFCWQAKVALEGVGRTVSDAATKRLELAGRFYGDFKVAGDSWDFGDSDNAFVSPFFLDETQASNEWRAWFRGEQSLALSWWWGSSFNKGSAQISPTDRVLTQAGYAISHNGQAVLRFDASQLGYLATSAHGHLDALHVSLWHGDQAIVIDPGTGAYYHDSTIRDYLASWEAHNGPHYLDESLPRRLGTFLWADAHPSPILRAEKTPLHSLVGELTIGNRKTRRTISEIENGSGWIVVDEGSDEGCLVVIWKFAPGIRVEAISRNFYRLHLRDRRFIIETDNWDGDRLTLPNNPAATGWTRAELNESDIAVVCSPNFRRLSVSTQLRLETDTHSGRKHTTTFRLEK